MLYIPLSRAYNAGMETNTKIKFKRNPNGRGYVTADNTWFIRTEGTATWWYAVQLDEQGWTIEDTKQYFRSYQEAKNYVTRELTKEVK